MKRFRQTGFLACLSVLWLFFLGGLVRVTGSGMGCPDWPRCFGLLTPPTCSCQLPLNYQTVFLEKRKIKIDKLTRMLDQLGFHKKADQIRSDRSIYVPEEFNAYKAWTEYINRIFGVIAGLFALFFALLAWLKPHSAGVRFFATFGLLMLILNAWLGSVVVATNLLPGIVTAHFILSFLTIFFFMLAVHSDHKITTGFKIAGTRKIWIFLFILLITEVILGALARENVDVIQNAKQMLYKGMLNYPEMGSSFVVHRFLPGLVFILSLFYLWKYRKYRSGRVGFLILSGLTLVQICFGAVNIVYVLPPWSQVLHILLGSFLPVCSFYFVLARPNGENS